jgi:hypothetical protein
VKPKRLLLPMLAAVLIGAAAASALAAASGLPLKPGDKLARQPQSNTSAKPRRHVNPAVVRRLRSTAWRWQTVIGVRHTHSAAPLHSASALRYWRRQVRHVSWLAAHPPHKRGWLCIHRFEGSWSDSGDPYWGGLQMDRGFMSTYAPRFLLRKGLANRWTALEQMWVAERAHRSGRGYGAWPNTARSCGLL